MSLFGPPDVEKLKSRKDVKRLIKALGYKRDDYKFTYVRKNAAEALGELGDQSAVEGLIAALHDPQHDVQFKAACSLGKLKNPAAVNPLIDTITNNLSSTDRYLREVAGNSLSLIHDPKSINRLVDLYRNDKNEHVRSIALETLTCFENEALIDLFVDAIDGGKEPIHENPLFGSCVADGLIRIGSKAVLPVLRLLSHDDERTREKAAKILGKIGDVRAIEPLLPLLKDNVDIVRSAAAGALESLGWKPTDTTAMAVLLIAKSDWSGLETMGTNAVEPLLDVFINDKSKDGAAPSNSIRVSVAKILGAIGDSRAVPALSIALKDDTLKISRLYNNGSSINGWMRVTEVVEASIDALGEIGNPKAARSLIEVAQTKDYAANQTINVLRSLLKNKSREFQSDDLHILAHFRDSNQSEWHTPTIFANEDVIVESVKTVFKVDCSEIRELARQELTRRSLAEN